MAFRRVALDGRIDALEERYGRPADVDGPTVADVLAEHPDLAEPLTVLWARRHLPPGDL